jgi:hypothetical protein
MHTTRIRRMWGRRSAAVGVAMALVVGGLALGAVPRTGNLYPSPVQAADSCSALTPSAIQQVINSITQSRASATQDVAANGTTGAYALAAKYNLEYLTTARDQWLSLQSWLKQHQLDTPYVSNASAAYTVHGYVRDSVEGLHIARHWATISVAYHKSQAARTSYEQTTQALMQAETVGAAAGRCYMAPYFP